MSQPKANPMPLQIRLTSSMAVSRAVSLKLRSTATIRASPAVMFTASPPDMVPTVSTAESMGSIRRDTTVCSAVMRYPAQAMASRAVWGAAPWPLLPCTAMWNRSTALVKYPL